MKKLFLFMLPLLAIAFTSCSSDDDKSGNTFTVGGDPYEIVSGTMEYYGAYYNDTTNNVDLTLITSDSSAFYIEIAVPLEEDRLVTGTYTLGTAAAPFTFQDECGLISNFNSQNQNSQYPDITAGTIVVAVSGEVYTITLNLTLEGEEGTVTGTYTGALEWYDASDD